MVFTSQLLFRRLKPVNGIGPHKFWRKRRILSLAAHLYGRRRRCFRVAIKYVHRSLMHSRNSFRSRHVLIKRIYTTRLEAACSEFNTDFESMRKVCNEAGIGLDRKILQNLAIWEPRTFRGLAMLTKARTEVQGLNSLEPPPKGVITRGML